MTEIFGTAANPNSSKWDEDLFGKLLTQGVIQGGGILGVVNPLSTGLLGFGQFLDKLVGRPKSESKLVKQGFEPVTTSVPSKTMVGNQVLNKLANRPPTPQDVAHNEKYGMHVAGNLWEGGPAYGQGVQTRRNEIREQRDDSYEEAKKKRAAWKEYLRLGTQGAYAYWESLP